MGHYQRTLALQSSLERHAHRWQIHRDAVEAHVREPLRDWFSSRYNEMVRVFVDEINQCDNIIGKQYHFDHSVPLVGHRELFTATVTKGAPSHE